MTLPDFRSRAVLAGHVRDTLAFYHPRCVDPSGGFYHFFRDDGAVYDAHTRHLVSSTRFVVNFARAWRHDGRAALARGAARTGSSSCAARTATRDTGGYRWVLRWDGGRATPLDATNHCYGLAFVLLAYAHAVLAGVDGARAASGRDVRRSWSGASGSRRRDCMPTRRAPDWAALSPYRGQNANMHACEAMLAAWEATREPRYLDRAETLAAQRHACGRRRSPAACCGSTTTPTGRSTGTTTATTARTSSGPGATSPGT